MRKKSRRIFKAKIYTQTREPLEAHRDSAEGTMPEGGHTGVEELRWRLHQQLLEGDSSTLPQDSDCLSVIAAAAGLRSVFLDYPDLCNDQELHEAAASICQTFKQAWPDVANDYALYCETFIAAFTFGYHFGCHLVGSATSDELEQVVKRVQTMAPMDSLCMHIDMLRAFMRKAGAKSIYDLSMK